MLLNDIYKKNTLNILSHISKSTKKNRDAMASVIAKKLKLSIGSVYENLKMLESNGLVESITVGRATLYEPVRNNYVLKQFKIFDNLVRLNPLVDELKKTAKKIILFGSCARGEDDFDSDVDIFVLVDDEYVGDIRKKINSFESERQINLIIVDSFELMQMQTEDKVFYDEINRGIVLWGLEHE